MASNSDFVVRLEVANVCSLDNGQPVESPMVQAGGFEWTLSVRQHPGYSIPVFQVFLTCNTPKQGEWECEVNAKAFKENLQFTFNNAQREHAVVKIVTFGLLLRRRYHSYGKYVAEFHVDIVKSTEYYAPDLSSLCSLNDKLNVTLVIGANRVRVSKDFLALHSPVFTSMFYGMFKENGRDEVEIKDVIYEEFTDLLSLLYSRRAKIRDYTVCHILELADRFEMKDVLYEAEEYLISSKKFSVEEKLQLADHYRLANLRDSCLLDCKDAATLQALKASSDYSSLSAETSDAICNPLMDLD